MQDEVWGLCEGHPDQAYRATFVFYGMCRVISRYSLVTFLEQPPPPPPTSSSSSRPAHKTNGSISGALTPPTPARSSSMRSIVSSRAASPQKTQPPATVARGRLVPPTPIKRSTVSQPTVVPSPTAQPTPTRVPSFGLQRQLSSSHQQALSNLQSRRPSIPQPVQQTSARSPALDLNSPPGKSPSLPRSPQPLQAPLTESPQPSSERLRALDLPHDSSSEASFDSNGTSASASPLPPVSQSRCDVLPAHICIWQISELPPPPAQQIDDSHELRVKLRVLETKRADDSRRIRELEGRLTEAETFVSVRPKLQAKLQQLQTETVTLKRTIADQATQMASLERKAEEQAEQIEMAMLDREVAEERAEVAEAELETEREGKAELEVELEVWRKGKVTSDVEGGDDGSGGRTEMAFKQLEKQNARLKEALIRSVR